MGVKLLSKMKIHELAKKIGVTSKEIIEKAQKLGIAVTSHLSNLEENQVKQLTESFNKNESNKKDQKTVKKENNTAGKKDSTPVIIRREVIIAEEEEKAKHEENKKVETHRKDVGFVERNNSKDYNIVYRNKQTKPLTVSELFGLKKEKTAEEKKEEKKEEVKETKIEEKEAVKEVKEVKEEKAETIKVE